MHDAREAPSSWMAPQDAGFAGLRVGSSASHAAPSVHTSSWDDWDEALDDAEGKESSPVRVRPPSSHDGKDAEEDMPRVHSEAASVAQPRGTHIRVAERKEMDDGPGSDGKQAETPRRPTVKKHGDPGVKADANFVDDDWDA